ncbi:phosphate acetyltransferase [Kocuria coralli]|uniref:Phosphate acetyltransferase n=1 Tax=Kocuria coralli TaxID=1461025 RepID=A0A5J5KW04_9MICC|nr:phosphate acetyltransferase [Kocuria coralli]KAA9393869.1 phosphate acetyltransferase [Kocuria coralli]
MTNGIYLSAMTPLSGKSLVALGLMDTLFKNSDRVGFFRAVHAGDAPEDDPLLQLIAETFELPPERCRGAVSLARTREILARGDYDELDSQAVAIYTEMATHCDVIVVDGTDMVAHNAAIAEFDLNARLANDMGCSVLAVIGANQTEAPDQILNAVEVTRTELREARCDIFAIMVNRCPAEWVDEVTETAPRGQHQLPVYVIPEVPAVASPTVEELVESAGFGTDLSSVPLDRDINGVKIAAMTVEHFLDQLVDGEFVIVPGDRSDVLMSCLAAALSPGRPTPAGMLLTGGLLPGELVQSFMQTAPFPVLTTGHDTYKAAKRVAQTRGRLSSASPRKSAAALGEWSRRIDSRELVSRLDLERPVRRTPLRFLHDLVEAARSDRKNIVLPEGDDPRVLRAAEIIHRRNFCDITILGDPEQVAKLCDAQGINLDFDDDGLTLVDHLNDQEKIDRYTDAYVEYRKHKGVTKEAALERMRDGSYFGTMMVQLGDVDGMVSGAVHTTANTIRPALEFVKTAEGVKIVSSVFFMCLEDRVLVYGDCAVNPNPNAAQLADIATASAATARAFGVDPRVAMLSYSTGGSGAGADVERVREATDIVKATNPDFEVEGPIQYDAAVDASIAKSKLPGSSVAGQATVFVFPDLNTGNNTYKAVQQSAGAVAVGPVLQGLRKPVNDLSRGCTVEDIVNTVAITAIQAQTM